MTAYTFEDQAECLMCLSPSSRNHLLGLRLNCRQGWRPRQRSGIATTVRRCIACGLTYPDPLPIPANIEDHYGVPPKDYWSESYFSLDEVYFKSEIAAAQKLLASNVLSVGSPMALDIGAGIGKCMAALTRAGFDAWGLEPSPSFRQMAIERFGISQQRLQLSGIEDAQYPANHFNFITFGAVLEHLYSPATCIKKALSWLKPGGIIHIEVPSSDYLLHLLLNGYYKLIGANFVANLSPMHSPYHLYEFTPKSFKALGKRLGYTLAAHSYHPASGRFVPKPIYPFFFRLMKFTNTGMQLTVWLRKPFS